MQRVKLLAVAVMAIFALTAIASATASAENVEILPVPTKTAPLKFTSKQVNEKNILRGEKSGTTITCKTVTGEGEFTSANLGTAHLDFNGCKNALNGGACTDLVDFKEGKEHGLILLFVDVHLIDVLLAGNVLNLGLAVVLLEELHLECGTLLILIKGAVLGEFLNFAKSGEKTKTGEVNFQAKEGKGQEFTMCDFDKAFCEGKTYKLEVNFGKGVEPGVEETKNTITLAKEAAFDY